MSRRYNYLEGDRLYSDVLNVDSSTPKSSVNYYKKVEKTTRKTVTDDGDNPRTRVESTTIIKENDNPEQITKKVYTSGAGNYGRIGYDENTENVNADYEDNNRYEVYSRRFESSTKEDGITGQQPSYLDSNKYISNGYKKTGTVETTRKIITTTTTSNNKTYSSNIGSSSLNGPINTGYYSKYLNSNSFSNKGNSYGDNNSYSSVRKSGYSNNIKIIENTGNDTNENNSNSYLAKANAILGNTQSNTNGSSYVNIKTTTETQRINAGLDNDDNSNTYLAKANAILGNTQSNADDVTNRINSYLSSIKSVTETEKKTTSILDNEDNSTSYLAKANAILGNTNQNTYLAKAKAILGNTQTNTNDVSNAGSSYLNIKTTTKETQRVNSVLDNDDNSNTYLAKANAILGNTQNITDNTENKATSYLTNIRVVSTEDKDNLNDKDNNNYTSGRVNSYKYSSYKNNTYSNNIKDDNKGNSSSFLNKYGPGVETRSYSYGNKEKYTFGGTVKEKDNYMYYVSGVGYVNKNGEPVKREVKETKTTIRSVSQPSSSMIRDERNSIKIETRRTDEKGQLIENYNYKESKDTTKKGKDSIVIHRRLGDPYYQNILEERRRYESYTQTIPGRGSKYNELTEKDYSSYFSNSQRKTNKNETDNYKYNNRTVNTRSLIDTSKYLNSNYKTNTNTEKDSKSIVNKYLNTNQTTTTKIDVSKYLKKNEGKTTSTTKESTSNYKTDYGRGNSNSRITTIEKRTEINKTSNTTNTPRSYVTSSFSQGRRKYVPPTYKTYEEKTEETYKTGRIQYNTNLGQKDYDTEKKNEKDYTNQYEKTTEEKYQKEINNENYQKEKYSPSKYQPKKEEITTENKYQQ